MQAEVLGIESWDYEGKAGRKCGRALHLRFLDKNVEGYACGVLRQDFLKYDKMFANDVVAVGEIIDADFDKRGYLTMSLPPLVPTKKVG
ncbi:hypothetical protein FACS18949_13420 [Clostridia bacterium]|nr:hypothetical protein FACS189425_06860 [Clostridia bacterium]GHV35436.1 hypothetical protein FACS18949_13420 [Clostridia bacterium]